MIKKKILSILGATKKIAGLKKQGKEVVFTNGCFDLLHNGHVRYLEAAKKLGDVLIVAINSDSSVKKLKGKNRPIVSHKERIEVIAALESVDFVILFEELTPLTVIEKIKPDVLVKGADWKNETIIGSDFVIKNGGKVKRARFIPGCSTTQLIKKIAKKNKS